MGVRRCRNSSHVSTLCVAGMTTILSILTVSQCTFVKTAASSHLASYSSNHNNNPKDDWVPLHQVGLFRWAVVDVQDSNHQVLGCVAFPDEQSSLHFGMDGHYRLSRAAGVMTATIMTATFVLLLYIIVFQPPSPTEERRRSPISTVSHSSASTATSTEAPSSSVSNNLCWRFGLWQAVRLGSATATLFTLLTFAILSSRFCQDMDCHLSSIGILTAFNVFGMATLTVLLCLEPTPPPTPWLQVWSDAHHFGGGDAEGTTTTTTVAEAHNGRQRRWSPLNSVARSHERNRLEHGGTATNSSSPSLPNFWSSSENVGSEGSSSNSINKNNEEEVHRWKRRIGKGNPLSSLFSKLSRNNNNNSTTTTTGNEDAVADVPDVVDDREDDESDLKSQCSANGSIVGYFKKSTFDTAPASAFSWDNWSFSSSVQQALVSSADIHNRWQRSFCFRLLWLVALVAAWLTSVLGVRNCNYLQWGAVKSHLTLGLGLYTRAFYLSPQPDMMGCIAYSASAKDNDFDHFFQAARVFGAVTALLMSVVVVACLAQCFTRIGCRMEVWLFVRSLLPFAAVSQALTHLVYSSDLCTTRTPVTVPHSSSSSSSETGDEDDDVRCIPGAMGYAILFNVLLIAVLSLLCCWLPPPSNPIFIRFQKTERDEELESAARSTTTMRRSTSDCGSRKVIRSIKPRKNTPLGTILDEQESVCSETEESSRFADEENSLQQQSEQSDYDSENDIVKEKDQEMGESGLVAAQGSDAQDDEESLHHPTDSSQLDDASVDTTAGICHEETTAGICYEEEKKQPNNDGNCNDNDDDESTSSRGGESSPAMSQANNITT
ncbi:hypothetical protein ACA910_006845 [Epithemia clementina (nom. ined.)]